jgi:hypothetical protein
MDEMQQSSDDRDLIETFQAVLRIVTRENLLDGGRNGGAVVTARAFSVTVILFLPAFLLSWLVTGGEFLEHFVERLPWLAAIFAAAYTAFYARYASQWSYLSNVHNQISQAELTPHLDAGALARWKAAFISDAAKLHLWKKGNFRAVCGRFWGTPQVREQFLQLPQDASLKRVAQHLDAKHS